MALDDQRKSNFKFVGTRPNRPDGMDKVTGRAKFGADMYAPGMLHGAILRSPHAHARITKLDVSRAEKLKGVKAIVTRADFSKKMYSRISFAIIKPGLGTIEECLKRAIIILPVMEKENMEFKYNSRVLIKKKLGFNFKTIKQKINFINFKFHNSKFKNIYLNRCKKLKWNDEAKIIQMLNQ